MDVTKLLIEHGADVTLVDSDGRTALHKVGSFDSKVDDLSYPGTPSFSVMYTGSLVKTITCMTSGGRDLVWHTRRHWTFAWRNTMERQLG